MARPHPPRILFICHSASRNGATILLLNTLRWLRTKVDWELEVLMAGTGPMLDDFRAIVRTTVWRNPAAILDSNRVGAGVRKHLETASIALLMHVRKFDLIYANTSAVWPLVEMLRHKAPALLWHIHELEYAIRNSMGGTDPTLALQQATRIVSVSSAVTKTLETTFGVPSRKIDMIHGFVPAFAEDTESRLARRNRVRRALGWPADAFVVGGCGSLGWRKGTDAFVLMARALMEMAPTLPWRFLWVGGQSGTAEALEFEHDVARLGLQARCRLVATSPDVSSFYCAMDAFALTSREDPFPLVTLEAAAHRLPIVCFQDSGGAPEFIGMDAGLAVPYLDIQGFAARIRELQSHAALRERLAAVAAQRVASDHTVESQCGRLIHSVERCLHHDATAFRTSDAWEPASARLHDRPRGHE